MELAVAMGSLLPSPLEEGFGDQEGEKLFYYVTTKCQAIFFFSEVRSHAFTISRPI